MLGIEQFRALLADAKSLVIDGGLATELEARGYDLNHSLWSAKLLRDDPAAIEQVHLDYFLAGANIAITASYQASLQGFTEQFEMDERQSVDLIKRSVDLARSASKAACQRQNDAQTELTLVAGSVGPLGACLSDGSEYRGDYERTKAELQAFHRPRIRALVDADVDLLAFETMPQLAEIEALLEMLRAEFPGVPAWLSCTLAEVGHISDGTCIEQVLRVVNQYQDVVVAFGVNCVPFHMVTEALQLMRRRTKLPLICYPNSGEVFDAEKKTWSADRGAHTDWKASTSEWCDNGARLIGGCCRTGPKHIRDVAHTLCRKSESIDQSNN